MLCYVLVALYSWQLQLLTVTSARRLLIGSCCLFERTELTNDELLQWRSNTRKVARKVLLLNFYMVAELKKKIEPLTKFKVTKNKITIEKTDYKISLNSNNTPPLLRKSKPNGNWIKLLDVWTEFAKLNKYAWVRLLFPLEDKVQVVLEPLSNNRYYVTLVYLW